MGNLEILVETWNNWNLYYETGELPEEGTWRRMRVLISIYDDERRVALDDEEYTFREFVEWYGPSRAEWYFDWARPEEALLDPDSGEYLGRGPPPKLLWIYDSDSDEGVEGENRWYGITRRVTLADVFG